MKTTKTKIHTKIAVDLKMKKKELKQTTENSKIDKNGL